MQQLIVSELDNEITCLYIYIVLLFISATFICNVVNVHIPDEHQEIINVHN